MKKYGPGYDETEMRMKIYDFISDLPTNGPDGGKSCDLTAIRMVLQYAQRRKRCIETAGDPVKWKKWCDRLDKSIARNERLSSKKPASVVG